MWQCLIATLISTNQFPAHIKWMENGTVIQSVSEHCRNCARIAGAALRSVGLEQAAYLAGLLHDMGKFKEEYRSYLTAQVFGSGGAGKGLQRFALCASAKPVGGVGGKLPSVRRSGAGCAEGLV
jgi:hypothetical protein